MSFTVKTGIPFGKKPLLIEETALEYDFPPLWAVTCT
jgi:hypothetical protein